MATYETAGFDANPPLTGSGEPSDVTASFLVTLTAVTLNAADVLRLAKIPLGAQVLDWYLDLESLSATAGELGDTGQDNGNGTTVAADPDRFCASDGVGTGLNSVYSDGVAGAVPFNYTVSDSELVLTVTTGSGGAVTGTVRGWVRYNMLAPAF